MFVIWITRPVVTPGVAVVGCRIDEAIGTAADGDSFAAAWTRNSSSLDCLPGGAAPCDFVTTAVDELFDVDTAPDCVEVPAARSTR